MSRAALRACARIAWRQAKLGRARSALILGLVALPIAGLSFLGSLIATAWPSDEQRSTATLGTAEMRLLGWPEGLTPEQLQAALPAGSHVVAGRTLLQSVAVDGWGTGVSLVELPVRLDEAPFAGIWLVRDGRAPLVAGEAAVSPALLRLLGARTGDVVTVGDVTLRIVGTIERPFRLGAGAPEGIVGAGTLVGRDDVFHTYPHLIDLPDGVSAEQAWSALARMPWFPDVAGYEDRDSVLAFDRVGRDEETALVFAGTAVALFWTGLVAAAAFAIGLRRQLRMLGLVGATGGEARHVRAVVLLGGTTLGLAGSVVGVALGVGATYAMGPRLEHLVGASPGGIRLSPFMLAGGLLLGTTAATLAALVPARSARRIAVVDALAGRTPPPTPSGRLARRGLLLVVVGAAVTTASTAAAAALGLAVGLVAMLAGALLAIPLAVSMLARIAGHLPTLWRLAARDSARHGRRTAAALGAAALALAVPVGGAAAGLGEEALEQRRAQLGAGQMLIYRFHQGADGLYQERYGEGLIGRIYHEDPVHAEWLDDLRGALRERFPGSLLEPVRLVAYPPGSLPGEDHPLYLWATGAPRVQETPEGTVTTHASSKLGIATPDLLRALGAERGIAALEEGKVVALGTGLVEGGEVEIGGLQAPPGRETPERLAAVEIALPRALPEVLPSFFVSESAARARGLVPVFASQYEIIDYTEAARPGSIAFYVIASQHVFHNPTPLSGDDIVAVKQIAQRSGAFAQSAADMLPPTGERLRALVLGIFSVLALAIVGVAVALVRAESRRDNTILAAVGAEPGTRRRLAGASAALLALLAGVIAVPTGILPVALVHSALAAPRPIVIPWLAACAVLVAVPLLASVVAGLVSREPKAMTILDPGT